jgi:hypothetical protein
MVFKVFLGLGLWYPNGFKAFIHGILHSTYAFLLSTNGLPLSTNAFQHSTNGPTLN